MSKAHRHRFFLGLILVSLALAVVGPFSPTPALSQAEPTGLTDVTLAIYPEYDDPLKLGYPTVLVMLDGQIQGAKPPTKVRFLVPKDAQMYSAGSGPRERYQPPSPLNRGASGIEGWDEISYDLKTEFFVVEYYAPVQTTAQKDFVATFRSLYPVTGLEVTVQEPRRATGFSAQPGVQAVTERRDTDSQGFKTTSYTYGGLAKDQDLSFNISYFKESLEPSLGGGGGGGGGSSDSGLLVFVIVIGVLVVGAGLYWALKKPSRPPARRDIRRQKTKAPVRASAPPPTAGKARFCTQCGERLSGSPRFCPGCGAKLRQ